MPHRVCNGTSSFRVPGSTCAGATVWQWAPRSHTRTSHPSLGIAGPPMASGIVSRTTACSWFCVNDVCDCRPLERRLVTAARIGAAALEPLACIPRVQQSCVTSPAILARFGHATRRDWRDSHGPRDVSTEGTHRLTRGARKPRVSTIVAAGDGHWQIQSSPLPQVAARSRRPLRRRRSTDRGRTVKPRRSLNDQTRRRQ
jgi:hypothetical protein